MPHTPLTQAGQHRERASARTGGTAATRWPRRTAGSPAWGSALHGDGRRAVAPRRRSSYGVDDLHGRPSVGGRRQCTGISPLYAIGERRRRGGERRRAPVARTRTGAGRAEAMGPPRRRVGDGAAARFADLDHLAVRRAAARSMLARPRRRTRLNVARSASSDAVARPRRPRCRSASEIDQVGAEIQEDVVTPAWACQLCAGSAARGAGRAVPRSGPEFARPPREDRSAG